MSRKRGTQQPTRTVIIPTQLGYLTKVLTNKQQLQKYNLSVISRFCAALNDGKGFGKFTRAHRNLLKEVEENTTQLYRFIIDLPQQLARAILMLAQTVNTSPKGVVAALTSYGLEHLALELSANASAPPLGSPNIKKLLREEPQSASQEFLDIPPKKVNYVDIEPPGPPAPNLGPKKADPLSLPSSEDF